MKITPIEADVKRAVLDWLNTLPETRCWRRNVGAFRGEYKGKKRFVRFGQTGMVDVEGVCFGYHVEIEIKRPGRVVTPEQLKWLDDMLGLGAIAFWCDSLDDAAEEMSALWKQKQLPWKDSYTPT